MEFYERKLERLEQTIHTIKKLNDELTLLIYEQPTELMYDKYTQSQKRKIDKHKYDKYYK